MGKTIRKFIFTLIVIGLLVLGIRHWWQKLSPRQKQFYENLISQVPDLPVRYMV